MVWEKLYFSSKRIKAVEGGKSFIEVPDAPHCFIEYPNNLVKKTRLKSVNEMIYGYNFNSFKVVFDDNAGEEYWSKKEFERYFSDEHIKMFEKLNHK